MSPPLLHPMLVSPIMMSRGMTDDFRCKAVLKTRPSPRLLASTTYPLPAHRPWSAGSMSLPVQMPLSTAFKPFTPLAPPEDELMRSQPGPLGWQLTVGGTLTTKDLGPGALRRGRVGNGITFGL